MISIIIPHHNSLMLLERCINSIPEREDIEIIVVDDHSDSSCYDSIKKFKKSNLHILSTSDTYGAGAARNVGLEAAKGQWIIFSDADDLFTQEAFRIIDSHLNDEADIVYFLSDHVYTDSMQLFDNNCMGLNDKVITYDGSDDSEDKLKYGICVPWGRMFKSSLIKENNIKFDEVRYGNDTMFSMKTAYKAKKVAVDPRTVYLFTVNRGSLTHKVNKESIACRMEVDLRKNQMMREIGKPQCQVSVSPHIYQASKFGLRFMLEMIKMSYKYHYSPFKGSIGWIKDHFKTIEVSKARKKYESE